MKIYHLISSGGMYGAENVILTLTQELRNQDIDAGIVVIHNRYNPQTELLNAATALDIPVHEIISRRQLDWSAVKQLREILVREKVNIIHSHNYKSDIFAWLAQRNIQTKFCITSHGWTSENLKVLFYEEIDRTVMNQSNAVVCVSKTLYLRNIKHGVRTHKILTIPNGIDIEHFSRRHTGKDDPSLHQYKDKFVVGLAGRMSPEKGHNVLMKSARIIVKKNPQVLFLLVGGGVLENELKNIARDNDMDKYFIFLGHQKDIKKFYRTIDILVMPSHREGLPMTLLEAMAMEVPVIASAVGDIPELIKNKKNGVLVAPGDEDALAAEIIELMNHKERRDIYAQISRKIVESHYSAIEMCSKYIDLYQKIIRSRLIYS